MHEAFLLLTLISVDEAFLALDELNSSSSLSNDIVALSLSGCSLNVKFKEAFPLASVSIVVSSGFTSSPFLDDVLHETTVIAIGAKILGAKMPPTNLLIFWSYINYIK